MERYNNSALSGFEEISALNREHEVYLVRHRESGQLNVMKKLAVYDPAVYYYLLRNPIEGLPAIKELIPIREEDPEHAPGLVVIEEYIPGVSLEEYLETNGPMTEQMAAAVIDKICFILGRMHALQPPMIHRDIKPTNVIIRMHRADQPMNTMNRFGFAKTSAGAVNRIGSIHRAMEESDRFCADFDIILIDLNAAKYASDKERDTRLLGTQGYAAPEQYGFGSSNPQTDIFALGKLLNTLLWGSYSGEIRPGRFSEIIRTCTELSPERRYRTVEEVRAALRDALEGRSRRSAARDGEVDGTPDNAQEYADPRRIFLPPGFRRGNGLYGLLALLGYLSIIYLCYNLQVQGASPRALLIEKIGCFIGLMLVVCCSCNYLGIRNHVSFCRSKNIVRKVFGIILLDLIVISCVFMVTLIIVVAVG